ncbi:GGDEF domain-containing protein [uncultured Psychromonas sp.]|uniref:GGDEF domain-containing protein n=1 Tax=uncultured Psychromonas sp. TaxID=173974 RepID=UPI0026167FCC|nr:GGDEF domain-containing protein [uncultured Psychromonas sp.]
MRIYDFLNKNISLKTFNAFFFASLFIIVFIGLYYQYTASNKITSENFQNSTYTKSLEIREKLRSIFDKLEYQFIQEESQNIEKLEQLSSLYNNQKEHLNLKAMAAALNEGVNFGQYEVFMINRDYVIEKASYEKEIGLNLGQFKIVKELFDKVFNHTVKLDISSPKLDLDSKLKRYLIKVSDDGQYILQLGFSLDYSEEINKQLEYFLTENSQINLYLATEFFIQEINIKSKEIESKSKHNQYVKELTQRFLSDINLALKNKEIEKLAASDTRKISLNKILVKLIPLNEKLISFTDEKKNTLNFYSSTGSLFGERSDTLLFIKTSFPLAPLDSDLRQNLNTFLFITVLILLVLTLFEYYKKREITEKITSITEMIKHNQIIKDEKSSIKDISVLIDSYNQMLAKLNNQITMNKALSYIDFLTGIKNRKAYDESIESLISQYKRYGTAFSLAIFDADDFKEINDNFGHSFGDIVLKNISSVLQANIRNGDMLFRIGGEEFIVIFPNTNLEKSKQAIEKIRKSISLNLTLNRKVNITLSIGLTEITNQDSKDSIFKRVDNFLYTSKKNGKNRVTSA